MRNKTQKYERIRSSFSFHPHHTPNISISTHLSDPPIPANSLALRITPTLFHTRPNSRTSLRPRTTVHRQLHRLTHTTMVAIHSLLYLIPALLAITPGSAALIPGVEVQSLHEIHMARIAANLALVSSPPAQPSSTKATLASRQYNPRKRGPKPRFRGRALASLTPVPDTILRTGGLENQGGPVVLNKFYVGSGFTENDNNPSECSPSY